MELSREPSAQNACCTSGFQLRLTSYAAAVVASVFIAACGTRALDAYFDLEVDEVNAADFDDFLKGWDYDWSGGNGTYSVGYVGEPARAGGMLIADFYEHMNLPASAGDWYHKEGVIRCCNLPRSREAYFRLRFGESIYSVIAVELRGVLSSHSLFLKYSSYFDSAQLEGDEFSVIYSSTTPGALRTELNALILTSTNRHITLLDVLVGALSSNLLGLSSWKDFIAHRIILSFDG